MYEDEKSIRARERADPTEGDRPWPLAMWLLIIAMTSFSFGYILLFTGDGTADRGDFRADSLPQLPSQFVLQDSPEPADSILDADALLAAGENVYQRVCMACHQSDGNGLSGAFPPLAGSSWVIGDESVPVKIVLGGLAGPIEVKGVTYNGIMPAFGGQLSDEEIASVVTYIRGAWGNQAEPVTAKTVAELRSNPRNSSLWSADELR